MQIYIIESGAYSDYTVHGFCTTEEQAKQACASLNGSLCNDFSEYLENYVYTYSCLDCFDSDCSLPILYLFRFAFRHVDKAHAWIGRCLVSEPYLVHAHFSRVKKSSDGFLVDVSVRANDNYLATKAAQDALYKHLASEAEALADHARRLAEDLGRSGCFPAAEAGDNA